MLGKTEVVVGGEIDQILSIDGSERRLGGRDFAKGAEEAVFAEGGKFVIGHGGR